MTGQSIWSKLIHKNSWFKVPHSFANCPAPKFWHRAAKVCWLCVQLVHQDISDLMGFTARVPARGPIRVTAVTVRSSEHWTSAISLVWKAPACFKTTQSLAKLASMPRDTMKSGNFHIQKDIDSNSDAFRGQEWCKNWALHWFPYQDWVSNGALEAFPTYQHRRLIDTNSASRAGLQQFLHSGQSFRWQTGCLKPAANVLNRRCVRWWINTINTIRCDNALFRVLYQKPRAWMSLGAYFPRNHGQPSNWEGSWEKTCSDLARLALTAAGLALAVPLVSLGLDSGSGIIHWIN